MLASTARAEGFPPLFRAVQCPGVGIGSPGNQVQGPRSPLLQSLSAVSLTKWQHGRHLLILPRMSRSGTASLLAAIWTKLFKGGLSPGLFLQEFKHSIAWEYEDHLQHALVQGRLLVAMVV